MRLPLSVALLSLLWLTPTPVLAQAAQETQPLSAAALQAAVNAAAQQAPANPTWSDVPVVRNIAVAPLPGDARITSSVGF